MLQLKLVRKQPSVEPSFEFESGQTYRASFMRSAAQSAYEAVAHGDADISQLAFFRASHAADWFSGTAKGMDSDQPSGAGERRLRAIRFGSQTLLECWYSEDGRPSGVEYFDGSVTRYQYDDTRRTRRITTSNGHNTVAVLRPDDTVESIAYDDDAPFRYDYDVDGRITALKFPDGAETTRTFSATGHVTSMTCAGIEAVLRWGARGRLESYEILDRGQSFNFRSGTRNLKCDLSVSTTGTHHVVHPLGTWRFDAPGMLSEMVTPWGERFRVSLRWRTLPAAVWTPGGQIRYAYHDNERLASIIHSDGTMSVCYWADDRRALLVHPTGVTQLRFDRHGRLVSVSNPRSERATFAYDLEGRMKRIVRGEDFTGILEGPDFIWATSPRHYFLALERDESGAPCKIIARGLHGQLYPALRSMLDLIWGRLALRSSTLIALGRS